MHNNSGENKKVTHDENSHADRRHRGVFGLKIVDDDSPRFQRLQNKSPHTVNVEKVFIDLSFTLTFMGLQEECVLSDPQGESDADADIEDTDCR